MARSWFMAAVFLMLAAVLSPAQMMGPGPGGYGGRYGGCGGMMGGPGWGWGTDRP